MSFAFMPVYTGDYLRDTRHLTPQKHGVYLLLLMHCWDQKGPLPLDEQECAGIANCRSADEIESLRYVLSKYFIKMDDGWYNKRMQTEIERAENISKSRSDAGRKGYQAKAKQLLSKSQASASTPTPTPTTTTTQKSKALSSKLDVAKQILEFLNTKTGRRFPPVDSNLKLIVARLNEGHSADDCRMVIARKWREWSVDEKMHQYARPKTLFNATNFNNYIGECVTEVPSGTMS